MSFETSLFVAAFVIVTSAILLIARFAKAKMQAKEEDMKQAAATRGWTFEKLHERGYRIYRFTGTTEGVRWVAESAVFTAGGNNRQKRRHVSRWHGQWSPGISTPIVAMGVPKGKEVPSFTVAEGDGFFARMAQKAAGFAFDKAIDVYFGHEIGKEVDAGTLRRVDTNLPGFIVMAGDVDEAKRILAEGLQRALADATNETTNVLSQTDRPYVLLRPQGISLARMEMFRDVAELDQFVRAGIGLTRGFRFGRPI